MWHKCATAGIERNVWLESVHHDHAYAKRLFPDILGSRRGCDPATRLEEIGQAWQHPGANSKIEENVVITTPNLATGQKILASDSPDTVGPDLANDGNFS